MKNWDFKHKNQILFFIMIVLVLIGFFWFENKHIVVDYYSVSSEKIGEDIDGFRIVQISDLHNAKFGRENEVLVKRIEELKPDVIVITGDLVDSNHTNLECAIQFIKGIVPICDVYYVTGNHEYWLEKSDLDYLINEINEAGVIDIDNTSITIEKGKSQLFMIGLDDKDLRNNTLSTLMDESAESFSILLAHEPQLFEEYAEEKVDLVLSGHAHGGQFRIPFVGGIVAPDQGFLPQYTEGEYQIGQTRMIVSRGLGNSIIPVRLLNDPEIVCVDLNRAVER